MLKHHVLDHGIVELINSMGDDLTIVNAAKASFNKTSDTFGDRERGILRRLIDDEHGVPFEHVVCSFRLRIPWFLAAQFKKHRHSSWSEHSGRYSEMEPLFYIPTEVRRQTGKAMDYNYEPAPALLAVYFMDSLSDLSQDALERYQSALKHGIAKEQARLFLPTNLYTTVVWTLNLRSLFNFLHLRLDSHAQWEAQEYARAIGELTASVVPETMMIWTKREMDR